MKKYFFALALIVFMVCYSPFLFAQDCNDNLSCSPLEESYTMPVSCQLELSVEDLIQGDFGCLSVSDLAIEIADDDPGNNLLVDGIGTFDYRITCIGSDCERANFSNCTNTVTIIDATPPVLQNCPESQTFLTGGDSIRYTAQLPMISDCGEIFIEYWERVEFGFEVAEGQIINRIIRSGESIDFRYSITDESGNNAQCEFTITVDPGPPVCETLNLLAATVTRPNCGLANGIAVINAQGGVPPYTFNWSTGREVNLPLGGNSDQISGLSPGIYTATLTDAEGCTQVLPAINLISEEVLDSISCPMSQEVTISDQSTGIFIEPEAPILGECLMDDINYILTGDFSGSGRGNGLPPITLFRPGNTEVTYNTFVDSISCTFSITVVQAVDECADLTFNINAIAAAGCADDNQGSIDITTIGGDGNYQYSWNNGADEEDLDNLSGGIYTILIRDGNGCEIQESFLVAETGSPSLSCSATQNGLGNDTITIVVAGDNFPSLLNFTLPDGSTGDSLFSEAGALQFTNIGSGDYSFQVENALECQVSCEGAIEAAINCAEFSAEITGNTSLDCPGDSASITVVPINGEAPFNYNWVPMEVSGNNPSLAVGEYTLTITDFNGCADIISFSIEGPTIVIESEIDAIICAGDSLRFGGAFLTEAGIYLDTLPTGLGCDSVIRLALTVSSEITVTGPTVSCDGSSVPWVATGAEAYTWVDLENPGITYSGAMADLPPGAYEVIGLVGESCTLRTDLIINVPSNFSWPDDIPDVLATCGTSVDAPELPLTPGQKIEWTSPGGTVTIAEEIPELFELGDHQFVLLTAEGCRADSVTVILVEDNTDPSLECPEGPTVVLQPGDILQFSEAEVLLNYPPVVLDNCGVASETFSADFLFDTPLTESTVLTYSIADEAGNPASCEVLFRIIPVDTLTIFVDSASVIETSPTTVLAPIKIANAENISGLQFSVRLSGENASFLNEAPIAPLLTANGSFVSERISDQEIRMIWFTGEASLSPEDSTTIVTLAIEIDGEPGACAQLDFGNNYPENVYATRGITEVFPTAIGAPVCLPAVGQISGNIQREDGRLLTGVTVRCLSEEADLTTVTDENGNYTFSDLPLGQVYEIIPSDDEDSHGLGVSLLDIVLLQNHILRPEESPLMTPYQRIAGNTSNSGDISLFDLVLTLNVLLDQQRFPGLNAWRFIPTSYAFPDPIRPWNPAFPESIVTEELLSDLNGQNFIGTKIGDVNNSAN
ncbi:MAG: hypothetical protein AAF828_06165 [Bacteroidota bacterium]